MSVVYGIYGASGYGKEVYSLVKSQLNDESKIVFIDDKSDEKILFGCEVLDYHGFLSLQSDDFFVSIAIADGQIRETLTNKCLNCPVSPRYGCLVS